jgi:large subunit ribosomal protein L17
MHRHSYIGKKLSRTAGPRKALMRGLLDALILYERVETTEIKAKELARNFDKLVTKAKKQDLHNYRQILSATINPVAAEKLYTELVKGFQGRNSGYCKLIKTGRRLGDGANMVVVELALDDGYLAEPKKQDKPKPESKKATKPAAKSAAPAKKAVKAKGAK